MEAYPKFYLPNDDPYSDKFKISIFEIFDKLVPTNERELKQCLDISGYYGRYKLFPLIKKGRKTNSYKVQIYLPNSRVSYNWPVLTSFKFDSIETLYRFYKRFPRCLTNVFIIGSKINCVRPMYIIEYGIEAEGSDITKSVDILHKIGLFFDNSCIITNPEDVIEVSKNLMIIKPY